MALHPLGGAFSVDLLINYAAFAASSLGGLAFLLICAAYLGMSGLGIVIQVMALFVVLAQLAVGGLHLSALHTSSDPALDDEEKHLRIWSAVFTATVWGACVAAVAFAANDLAGLFFGSPQVSTGWAHAAPALTIFSLNKVCAATLNGLNRMRRFAVQTALRTFLLALLTWLLVIQGAGPAEVCWAFLGAETILSVYLLAQLVLIDDWPPLAALSPGRIARHLLFGLRGVWSGLAYEINLRLDVLMTGFFLNDSAVGLYGLVSQLAEGFFSILVVLRNQLAPILARLTASKDSLELSRLATSLLTLVVPIAALAAGIAAALYPPVISIILPGQGYEAGTPLLAILLLGLVVNAWLIPLDTILVVSGSPGLYSLMMVSVVATNASANLALIPVFGLHGAAVATCLATVLSGIYLLLCVRYRLGFWLMPSLAELARIYKPGKQLHTD